jgi:hypothetical protein
MAVGIWVWEVDTSFIVRAFSAISSVVCIGFLAQKSSSSLACLNWDSGVALARASAARRKDARKDRMMNGCGTGVLGAADLDMFSTWQMLVVVLRCNRR